MTDARQWLLTIANVITALAVCFFVFAGKPGTSESTPAQAAAVDLEPLLKPIATLDESLVQFASTLQRFNTTLVQYDFLQKEVERLGNFDQMVAARLNQEINAKAQMEEGDTEAIDANITQLKEFQEKVQQELEQRRQMMMQLIAGLEQELAKSNIDDESVRNMIGDTPPATNPNLDQGLPAITTPED